VSPDRRALAALAATTVFWGSTFVIVGDLVDTTQPRSAFPPFLLVALRFGIAAAGFLAIAYAKGMTLDAAAWRRGAILGVITFGGFAFQTLGMQLTTSARSAFVTNVSLPLVPIFGSLLGRGRPSWGTLFGLAIAFGGLAALELGGPPDNVPVDSRTSDLRLRGDLVTLGCAVLFAFQILATESFARTTPLLPLVAVQFLVCSALGVGASFAAGEQLLPAHFARGTASVVSQILFLGILATGAGLFVQAWAQRHTTATRVALIFTLEPVSATALAYVIRDERLGKLQGLGAGLGLLGIVLSEVLARGGVRPMAREPLAQGSAGSSR
jgi:drug/metabolite transporter (DMT)-like permease